MNNSKLMIQAALSSVGVFVYVSGVAWILVNGERIFGKMQTPVGPVAFLLLLVLSATITGSLVLGRPIYLYLEGMKKEAVRLFFFTLAALALITAAVFSYIWLIFG